MASTLQVIIILVIACSFVSLLLLFLWHQNKRVSGNERYLDKLSAKQSMEEQIRISKRELETVFDAITDLICIIDRNYKIVRVNQSCSAFLKTPIRQLLGQPCYKVLWNRNEVCDECSSRETFTTGEALSCRRIMKRSQHENEYFEIQTYPVFNERKKAVHVIEFIRNITNEKRMNEQLIRSEKLASIGIMTSGIAHEINNPLSGISGTAVNLLEMPHKYGLNEKGINRVSTILELADRATGIMKDLLHLSRKHDNTSALVNINRLVEKTVQAVHVVETTVTHRRFNLDSNIHPINCDPSKIELVIMNITTNALQSIQEKAKLCKLEHKDYTGILYVTTRIQPECVLITITDNGIGIPEDNRSRIFMPFFSTRPAGQGTGLGLSICHRIIDEHGGSIYFDNVNDKTMFSIELPFERKNMYEIMT
jgi:two-component system NtrC family sensor kinase